MAVARTTAAPSSLGGAAPMRPLAKLALGAACVLALLAIGYRFGAAPSEAVRMAAPTATDAESCLRRGCDVHFTATLVTQRYAERLGIRDQVEPRLRTAQAVVLSATAHAGSVRDLGLDNRVFLRDGEMTYPAAQRPLQLTTHHNSYLVFLPRYDMRGRPLFERPSGELHLVVRQVGDEADEHVLTFRLPLAVAQSDRPDLLQMLMVIGAAMSALLLTCTPCLVGSLMVGSLTTGTAAGLAGRALARQTLLYLGGLVVVYLAVAAAVNLFSLRIEALRPAEFLGGLVLFGLGLWFLAGWEPLAGLAARARRRLAGPRGDALASQPLGPGTSSAMGASLAMVCSVAGAPTLSTAILLPLLVSAGLSSPLWALLLLLVYLLLCAVPFALVAVGLGEFLLAASARWRGALLVANALVLMGLGGLLLVSSSSVADAVAAPARVLLAPLRWLL